MQEALRSDYFYLALTSVSWFYDKNLLDDETIKKDVNLKLPHEGGMKIYNFHPYKVNIKKLGIE